MPISALRVEQGVDQDVIIFAEFPEKAKKWEEDQAPQDNPDNELLRLHSQIANDYCVYCAAALLGTCRRVQLEEREGKVLVYAEGEKDIYDSDEAACQSDLPLDEHIFTTH